MAKLNVILKSELVSIQVHLLQWEKGSTTTKNLPLKITSFGQPGRAYSFDDFAILNYESHKFKHLIKKSLATCYQG